MLNVVEPARYIKVSLLFLHSEVHLRGKKIKVPINCIINIMKRGEKKEVQSFTADLNLQKSCYCPAVFYLHFTDKNSAQNICLFPQMNTSAEWNIHLYDILGGEGKDVSLLEFNQSTNPYNREEQERVPELA